MKKSILFLFLVCFISFGYSQKKKTVKELTFAAQSSWPVVYTWSIQAKNNVEILPKSKKAADSALYNLQMTTQSTLGSIIYESAGILVGDGWVRLLGSGDGDMTRGIADWNKGKTFKEYGDQPKILLIADDIVGGFFAINGGVLGEDLGNVYYLAPDTLFWEPLGVGYSDFVHWVFNADLADFYVDLGYTDLVANQSEVSADKAYFFEPSLFEKHDGIGSLKKSVIDVDEVWFYNQEVIRHLNDSQEEKGK